MEGLLLLNKPLGKTSFFLISYLRKLTGVKKIGHIGTLDPLATGVMGLLIGRTYTRKAPSLMGLDKEYRATLFLGASTETYDREGAVTFSSPYIPLLQEIEEKLSSFQGEVLQTPPMFSAIKIGGKKLYELARKGISIDRSPKKILLKTTLIRYEYPLLEMDISCSSGTYIRSIAQDLGALLGCGAHLHQLIRTKLGPYSIEECYSLEQLLTPIDPLLRNLL